jgi:glycosyltransferase involved in cell wall biosynthesis
MQILFIGGLYPKEIENKINDNILINYQFAANNLQWGLVEGLSFLFKNMSIITAPTVGCYPKGYKKISVSSSTFKNEFIPESKNISVGFLNLPLISLISKYFSIKKEINKLLKNNLTPKTHIIVYSPHTPFLKPAIEAKRKYKNIKVTLIVPDLPNFMSDNNNVVYKLLKKIDNAQLANLIKQIDSFVLLSKFMKEPLKVENRKWVLVEGIFQSIKEYTYSPNKTKEKVVLYTGAITKKDGIFTLIEAFKKIPDSDYRLWLRGNGTILPDVLESIKEDKRIQWIDKLSRKELIQLQQKATVLINPMPVNDKSAKYFFPSKMMDYLASGTPTITTKLPGIPEEYFNYCFVAEKDEAEGLKEKIIEISEKPQIELEEFGRKARKFILENKNPIKQVEKIFKMLNS